MQPVFTAMAATVSIFVFTHSAHADEITDSSEHAAPVQVAALTTQLATVAITKMQSVHESIQPGYSTTLRIRPRCAESTRQLVQVLQQSLFHAAMLLLDGKS